MAFLKSIKEWLPFMKFAWPVLGAFPYAKYEIQLLSWLNTSNVVLLRVAFIAIALVLIGLTVAIVLWLKNKPKLTFNQEVGAYVDKAGVWYCTSCKAAGKLAPLLKTKDHELICQVASCKQFYYLPEYKPTDWSRIINHPSL